MARGLGNGAVADDAWRSRSFHGRNRRGKQNGSSPRDGSTGSRRSVTSRSNSTQGKPRTNGHRRSVRKPQRSWIHLLPEDIAAQSLLPFLVWHETSALGCVNKQWADVMSHASDHCPQWKTTTCEGVSARECLGGMAKRLGRGGTDVLRFAPTFAMVTVAFADAQDARHAQAVWNELVETVVSADVLPVGCVLVGMLNANLHDVRREEETALVSVTISIGHLAQTVVDTAAFDRKALRWSASGLTEELECPFDDASKIQDVNEAIKTSLFVWSTSAKPADVMLSLAKQWFPGASVAGGVVARADHAPPLMVFTRSVNNSRRSKLQAKRKMKTTTNISPGVLSFPSTLLVRLQGKTFIKAMELCLDRPLTPILKNEAHTVMEDIQFMRQDYRTYDSVSTVDETSSVPTIHSLNAIVEHFAREEDHNGLDTSITLLSATALDDLRRVLATNGESLSESQDLDKTLPGDLRSIPLYIGRLGMITSSDHWGVGHYGVLTVRRKGEELIAHIKRQATHLFTGVKQGPETLLASVVVCSTDFDEDLRLSIMSVLRRCMSEIPVHDAVVDGEIGPMGVPHPVGVSPSQLRARSISTFIVCFSA